MDYTDEQIDAAPALLAEFLEGMPEIIVDRKSVGVVIVTPIGETNVVDYSYDGNDHDYIKESFSQFLDQMHC